MSWIQPKTNRMSLTVETADDMNRIVGNIAELGGEPIKSTYTDDDIVTHTEWSYIVNFARIGDATISMSSRWDNLNRLESALESIRNGHRWYEYAAETWENVHSLTWAEMRGI